MAADYLFGTYLWVENITRREIGSGCLNAP